MGSLFGIAFGWRAKPFHPILESFPEAANLVADGLFPQVTPSAQGASTLVTVEILCWSGQFLKKAHGHGPYQRHLFCVPGFLLKISEPGWIQRLSGSQFCSLAVMTRDFFASYKICHRLAHDMLRWLPQETCLVVVISHAEKLKSDIQTSVMGYISSRNNV